MSEAKDTLILALKLLDLTKVSLEGLIDPIEEFDKGEAINEITLSSKWLNIIANHIKSAMTELGIEHEDTKEN